MGFAPGLLAALSGEMRLGAPAPIYSFACGLKIRDKGLIRCIGLLGEALQIVEEHPA